MKKGKVVQLVVSIAIIFLAFIIAIFAGSIDFDQNGSDIISLDKILKTLKDPVFIFQTLGITLLLETTYIGIYNARDAINKSSKSWNDIIKEYDMANIFKNSNYKDFVECIRQTNLQLKKEVYLSKLEHLRAKLQNKYDKISNEKLGCKKAKRLKAKIQFLDDKINSKNIDEDVMKSNIKYSKIKIEDFGRIVVGEIKSKYDFENKQNIKFSKSAVIKLFVKIIWATIFSSITIQAFLSFKFNIGFWIIIASNGLGVLMTIASGINIADKLHESEAVASISNRISFINDDFKVYLSINNKKSYEERLEMAVNVEIEKRIEFAKNKEKEKIKL